MDFNWRLYGDFCVYKFRLKFKDLKRIMICQLRGEVESEKLMIRAPIRFVSESEFFVTKLTLTLFAQRFVYLHTPQSWVVVCAHTDLGSSRYTHHIYMCIVWGIWAHFFSPFNDRWIENCFGWAINKCTQKTYKTLRFLVISSEKLCEG